MENRKDLRAAVLVSIQRALLGMIYPAIRAITVGYETDKVRVTYYLDREPNEDDYENISEVTTEIMADFPNFNKVEEICLHAKEPKGKIKTSDIWVYSRRED